MSNLWLTVLAGLLLTGGLVVGFCLLFSLRRALHHVSALAAAVPAELGIRLEKIEATVNDLGQRQGELELRLSRLPQLSAPKPSMNLARRSQALRMYRRGERPEQIAAALGIPQGEVDLLLKLHRSFAA